MSNLFDSLRDKLSNTTKRIVLPEGSDERILEAASKLAQEGAVTPVLVGNPDELKQKASDLNLDLGNADILDPNNYSQFDAMVASFVERRKGKATEEKAREILKDENYFGTMLVYMGEADGLVSGAAHSTADTVRPALQIIKTKPGIKKTSGIFIMVKDEEKYAFADCAINISPDSQDLAEIALASADTAKLFDIDPRVAMLSFSTKGSAQSPETEKVTEAVKIAKEQNPELALDGEFQFDAAFVPSVAEKKAPGSELNGDANVFVFPSLEAGNIGYKIAQRMGGFDAVGPVLQGLNQPVNDLSRGCSADDVYKLSLITAAQSL
ncbi:phosphate acetyltransferase [Pontibacillus salipaludis]|uniref:Phosphate acetyltransferase n=1 Tax=Pontibacillus salipaludis TaxID=1697394 RepID=A0ABQ1PQ25_9BACI|nr:phosphate acetyltransferase [Pontibacillus salipaludis]GGD00978.1 phosphate acetyltransferase [Pontibacillus salipaludis]